jgi:RNA polymerase sigma-70 factor (ECF subfamily)
LTAPSDETALGGSNRAFQSTLWTVVLKAKEVGAADRRDALQKLIETYWKPVYLFIRRRGNDREAGKDLAQGFFTALLERNFLQYVERDRGKFRTFLLTALDHYLADEHDRAQALKRGGGRAVFSLDFATAEAALEASGTEPADWLFRRDWALRVMAEALESLRQDFFAQGRASEFAAFRLHLTEGTQGAPSGAELARTLGISEGEVRKRIHRARADYRESILRVIRDYTGSEEDTREELADLFTAFS